MWTQSAHVAPCNRMHVSLVHTPSTQHPHSPVVSPMLASLLTRHVRLDRSPLARVAAAESAGEVRAQTVAFGHETRLMPARGVALVLSLLHAIPQLAGAEVRRRCAHYAHCGAGAAECRDQPPHVRRRVAGGVAAEGLADGQQYAAVSVVRVCLRGEPRPRLVALARQRLDLRAEGEQLLSRGNQLVAY